MEFIAHREREHCVFGLKESRSIDLWHPVEDLRTVGIEALVATLIRDLRDPECGRIGRAWNSEFGDFDHVCRRIRAFNDNVSFVGKTENKERKNRKVGGVGGSLCRERLCFSKMLSLFCTETWALRDVVRERGACRN